MMTSATPDLVRALFDHSPLPQLVFDRETLAILDVNEAAIRHYGYTRAEFLALGMLDLRLPEEHARMRAEVERSVQGPAEPRGVWRHVKKDRSLIDVEVVAADFELARRRARLVTVRDVTDERRAVEALRHNEQRFRAVVENSADALVLQDAEGRPFWASAASRHIFGSEPEAIIGRQGLELVHPEDRDRVRAAREASLARPFERVRCVARYAVDGRPWRWLDTVRENRLADPAVGAVVLHLRDITEQRAVEEALRRSEESFRAAIEHAPDLVVVAREGRFTYVNDAVVAALGLDREALLGRALLDFVHHDDRAAAAAALARAGEPKPEPDELRLVRADGEYLRVDFRGVEVVFDGAPSVLAFGRDVTARRLLEARLAAADRMSSLGELAAGVAHEINNPVSYALANIAFVAETVTPLLEGASQEDARDVSDALRDARQGLERVRDIVRDLKTFSRAEDEAFGPVDLHAVLAAACSMSRNEVKHRARLVQRHAPGAWVRGDEGKLVQVFVNLLVNAAQAIPDGHADEHTISVGVTPWPGGRHAVEVTDTGQGIAAEHLRRLFDPFFTTKPKGLGTGLGLSICHSLVRAHGGEIEVETSPGEGSCFRVLLPFGSPPQAAAAAAPAAPGATRGRRTRVLLVDDEPRVCDALVRLLSAEHELRAVTSGRAALELVRAGERYDAVLCDVMMPEMTGVQFHQALSQLAPELARRLAFMTGGVFSAEARRLVDLSGRPVVHKPFDRAALLACLGALCAGAAAEPVPA